MKSLLLSLLFVYPLLSMELVEHRAVSAKNALNLYTNNKDFYVEDENAAYRVEKHNIEPMLKEIAKRKAVKEFVDAGYIRVNKNSEGKYELAAKVRGKGGGPWLSAAVFLGVQVAGYTGLMTGAIVANTLAPGAGTAATTIALGTGGVAGATAAIQSTALTWSAWAFALPTP